ncbi:MAG: transporter [Syntrophorhabdales bacterium]
MKKIDKRRMPCSPQARRTGKDLCVMVILLPLLLGALMMTPAYAIENGKTANPGGADDWLDCMAPPPGGIYGLAYTGYFWADRFNDSHGRPQVPIFHTNYELTAFRIGYMTKWKFLGADVGFNAIMPFARGYADVGIPAIGYRNSQTKAGYGDTVLGPIILGWHGKNFHQVATIQIYTPTGMYDKNDLVNLGNNVWTFEPVYSFTYLGDKGFDVAAKCMYDINTKNQSTDYLSGQALTIDYSIGQRYKNFRFGVVGNFYKQLSQDQQFSVIYNNGNKAQSFSIGPAITMDYKFLFFELKYEKGLDVRNMPVLDKIYFKIAMPLAIL